MQTKIQYMVEEELLFNIKNPYYITWALKVIFM